MFYQVVLYLHSWLRWGVVLLGALTLARAVHGWARAREWNQTDRRVQKLFVAFFDSQVLLGLTLYFALSPLTPKSLDAFRVAMSNSMLRFFGIEHAFSMVLALIIAHGASNASRKAEHSTVKHRRWAEGLLIALLFILVGIPWPVLPYGRPLLRTF
jgi:phosphoglycerol transferase MdoB-like AlkP superfamily enzyme